MLFLGSILGRGHVPVRTQSLGRHFPAPRPCPPGECQQKFWVSQPKAGSALPDSRQKQLPLKIAFCVRRKQQDPGTEQTLYFLHAACLQTAQSRENEVKWLFPSLLGPGDTADESPKQILTHCLGAHETVQPSHVTLEPFNFGEGQIQKSNRIQIFVYTL